MMGWILALCIVAIFIPAFAATVYIIATGDGKTGPRPTKEDEFDA